MRSLDLLKLPYLGNISHHVEKELKEFIDKHLPDTMLRFFHVTKNLKQQLHFKDPQPQLLRSNVVYRLNCMCTFLCFYIFIDSCLSASAARFGGLTYNLSLIDFKLSA